MTYRLVLDEHRRFCERLVQRVLRLVWQRQRVHERLVHSLIHCKRTMCLFEYAERFGKMKIKQQNRLET